MRTFKKIMLVGLLAGVVISGSASADPWHGGHRHGGGANIGFYFGPGYGSGFGPGPGYYGPGWGPYYPRPYYAVPTYPYYPPVIVAPAPAPVPPPVYIEQAPQEAAPVPPASSQAGSFWYHCNQPEGYYPYVKECPQGWQKVNPQPPSQ
ncbi:hypothetical protein LG201_11635 [Methylobacillus gramineus]|uniref:hypothetical protein n=1 Tax=Methylobacillus gramineus TaxID=755169 RepID=UPI001D000809|nr:hypothetical protein [Methylobacillus gramineus]MCB5185854.1 hypothetical protein [Methylobacillus gramineus]